MPVDSYAGQSNTGRIRRTPSVRVGHAIYGAILLVTIASVARSQQPVVPGGGYPSHESADYDQNPGRIAGRIGGLATAGSGVKIRSKTDSQPADGGQPTLPAGFYEKPAEKAGSAARVGAAGEMIGFSHADASGSQTITLVHTGKSWIAVYHIDRSGTVRLVSSRPIDADFSLQLNATSPLPDEIREMATKR